MARFSLHAVGPDRPGIVAEVTEALAALGCNLEDSRMTMLRGQFAIVLVLEAPGVDSGMAIEEALMPAIEALGLQLLVCPVPDAPEDSSAGLVVDISFRGADQAGTVARVARAVSNLGANILDLVGHVGDKSAEAPSLLELTVALPDADALEGLRSALSDLSGQFGSRLEISAPRGG